MTEEVDVERYARALHAKRHPDREFNDERCMCLAVARRDLARKDVTPPEAIREA